MFAVAMKKVAAVVARAAVEVQTRRYAADV
jgi:hypothetical protein